MNTGTLKGEVRRLGDRWYIVSVTKGDFYGLILFARLGYATREEAEAVLKRHQP